MRSLWHFTHVLYGFRSAKWHTCYLVNSQSRRLQKTCCYIPEGANKPLPSWLIISKSYFWFAKNPSTVINYPNMLGVELTLWKDLPYHGLQLLFPAGFHKAEIKFIIVWETRAVLLLISNYWVKENQIMYYF